MTVMDLWKDFMMDLWKDFMFQMINQVLTWKMTRSEDCVKFMKMIGFQKDFAQFSNWEGHSLRTVMNVWFAEYDLALWIYGLPKMDLAKARSEDCDDFMKAYLHSHVSIKSVHTNHVLGPG